MPTLSCSLVASVSYRNQGLGARRAEHSVCRTLYLDRPILGSNKGVATNGGFWGVGQKALGFLGRCCCGRPSRRALALHENECDGEEAEAGDKHSLHSVAI